MHAAVIALIFVVLAQGHGGGPAGPPLPPADLVVRGEVIHTGAAGISDPSPGRVPLTAMAIRNGCIVRIGDGPSVSPLIGAGTRVLDLNGLTVLPGLVDSRGHVLGLGDLLAEVDVTGTASYVAVFESVRVRAARTPAGEWIQGRGWDQNDWVEKSFPQHAALSAAVPEHPVAIARVDGHALLVNRRALELARITRDTPDPPGGEILHDAGGEPAGVLVDNAEDLVTALIPPLSPAQREERLLAAMRECARYGLTLVGDAGIGRETFPSDSLARVAVRARAKGLQVRVHCIGDLANTKTLEAFERAFGGQPRPALRWAV